MWKEAKNQIQTEYPDLEQNTLDFYLLAIDNYKSLNKLASNDDIIQSLYLEGVLSKESLSKYNTEKIDTKVLSKVAGIKDFFTSDSAKTFGNRALDSLLAAGATGLVAGGIYGGSKLISKINNKLQRKNRLEKIYKFNPTLRDADKSVINAAMDDFENLNPTVAKSPLLAGSAMKSIIDYGGFSPDQAGVIAGVKNDTGMSPLRSALEATNATFSEKGKKLYWNKKYKIDDNDEDETPDELMSNEYYKQIGRNNANALLKKSSSSNFVSAKQLF